MSDEINYHNNPLHGLSLKNLLIELVDHYGFKILFAYLNINCFKTNPSIESSIKFLKKTDWAREKVEAFYLYKFKNLPSPSSEQFSIPPRDRIVPDGHTPREPAELSFEDAEQQREKQAKKAAAYRPASASGKKFGQNPARGPSNKASGAGSSYRDRDGQRDRDRKTSDSASGQTEGRIDPWANARK